MTFWKTVRTVTCVVLVFVSVSIITVLIIYTPAGYELIFNKTMNEKKVKDNPLIKSINKYDETLFYLPQQTTTTTNMANTSNNYNDYSGGDNSSSSHPPPNYFTPCHSGLDHKLNKRLNNSDCLEIDFPIFTKTIPRRKLLNPKKGQGYVLPNSHAIPRQNGGENKLGYCGYGHLIFDQRKKAWSCSCMTPEYFGGKTCDAIQRKYIDKYNCKKVASFDDPSNTDLSTFIPIIEGVCVECAFPETQIPVKNPKIFPQCKNVS